jgi:TIR domain
VGQLFVSYSRRDESFVHRLHAVLERELQGTRVWLDRDDMPSRMRSFRVEYVDAATSSDRMLLVVSPASMRSPEVEFEWRSALECCLPVVPLLVEGTLDLVPQELRKPDLNVILFTPPSSEDGATSRLLGILRESIIPPTQLFSVPELPPHFITRLEALGNLRELVMPGNRSPTFITSATRTSALVGMSGVGKSVLAA